MRPTFVFKTSLRRHAMKWSAPVVAEICVGMEVTSYESAEIDTFN
jgi:coenzyme PQQ precursor peptide PqqA